jgi:hypothetical protein
MRKLLALVPLLAVIVHAMSACGPGSSSTSHRAWTSEDSWYTGLPPEGPLYWTWPELDRSRIHEVIEWLEPQAEELLQDASIVELSSEQAAEFIGEALPELSGTKPYLTRGVYLNRETGSFSVYILEGQLLVYHGSLGRSAVPMTRQALVLQLEHKPTEVFVACRMAE